MSDEEDFIRAILANPRDDALRLIYADWLEERGDHRAEYLRLLATLSEMPFPEDRSASLSARLEELQSEIDPLWLADMHRGRVSNRRDPLLGDRPRRRRRREVTEGEIGLFMQQYARKARRGLDPNDRHYSRKVEKQVKRMKPEKLDRLIRGEEP